MLQISTRSIRRELKALHFRPYKPIHVHQVLPGDNIKRAEFCRRFLLQADEKGMSFLDQILWTDECIIRLVSYENKQNRRFWSFERPDFTIEVPQYPKQIHVWVGIYSRGTIGPYFFYGKQFHFIIIFS